MNKKYSEDNCKTRVKNRLLKLLLTVGIVVVVVISTVGLVFAVYVDRNIETEIDESLFANINGEGTTRIYYYEFEDRENREGSVKELEHEVLYGGYKCIYANYEEIPKELVNAFISIEDKRFYSHSGVDLRRTASAAVNYLFGKGKSFGGSTITQQLIKNVTQKDEYSFERKLQEIFWAYDLETKMSKEEILEIYLNIINMSEGCYGVKAAAQYYFSKEFSELSLIECACLAAITNSPSYYDPILNPDNNTYRRELILNEMYEQGYISKAELDECIGKEINLNVAKRSERSSVNSWYTDMVIEDVINALIEEKGYSRQMANLMIYTGGLSIYTAMDIDVQEKLENYYNNTSNFYDVKGDKAPQSSIIVIDRSTGDILGVVGAVGKKSANRIQNFATQTLRPAGSAIKPLSVYAPALEKGILTWSTVYDDVPVNFGNYNIDAGIAPKPWPSNSSGTYRGLTNVNYAVEHSLNTVVVRALYDLGIEESFGFLYNELSMKSLIDVSQLENGKIITDKDVAALALGQFNYGVTVRELTAAYSALANDGVYNKSRSYLRVTDSKGNEILANDYEGKAVISKENADIMTLMLKNVIEKGTAKSITLDENIDAAGKTGTTQNNYDKWFVGYTADYICGVWYGYEYPETIVDSVANRSVKVWDDVMKSLYKNEIKNGEKVKFDISDKVVVAEYCADSGLRLTDACSKDPRGNRAEKGYFVKGSEPSRYCDRHVIVNYDTEYGGVASEECEEVVQVALIYAHRSFPREVYVADAQYVWRYIGDEILPNVAEDKAFFANVLAENEYCGISKVDKQYNRYCRKHFNYYAWKEKQE